MEIAEYTACILHLIKAALALPEVDKSLPAHQVRYLYRQALYGYSDFAEQFGHKYVSQAAQTEYERLRKPGQVTQWKFLEQGKFDCGRKNGVFHFEHVYTLGMLARAIHELHARNDVSVQSVNQIVETEYAVAWITKKEDQLLRQKYKSKRGESLQDALRCYAELGIHLIGKDGMPVS